MSQSQWTQPDLAYFAGIIDGEGCISIQPQKLNCRLTVGNTSLDLLLWIKQRFSGSISHERYQDKRRKPFWCWMASAEDIAAILTAIRPYLVVKGERADLMIAYRQTTIPASQRERDARGRMNVVPISPSVTEQRRAITSQLAALNKRGAA